MPLHVKSFEYILKGHDVAAILPTGFGKFLLFRLLSHVLPAIKAKSNIIIVVSPLNSFIEDQMKILQKGGVDADGLQLVSEE